MYRYYCYRHIRLDKNEVFYIGIAEKKNKKYFNSYKDEYKRAFSKKRGNNHHFNNIVKSIFYEVEIIFECNSFEEICKKEIEFIKLYGRADLKLGFLTNLTNGGSGEGFRNKKHSKSTKEKISEARVKQIFTEEVKQKRRVNSAKAIREQRKGKSFEEIFGIEKSKEIKQKISNTSKGTLPWNTGKKHSEETRRKISESNKGKIGTFSSKKHTKETKIKMAEKAKGRKINVSPEGRERTKKANSIAVLQFSLSDEFIKEFKSISEAMTHTKIKSIGACCKGKRKTSGGYKWKYKE